MKLMKTKHWFAFIFSVFAVAIAAGLIKNANNTALTGGLGSTGGHGGASGDTHSFINPAAPPNNNLSLITEPADGMAPVLAMIKSASTSVDLVMYELEDTSIEAALITAAKRGVAVRVLLNEGYYGVPDNPDKIANEPAYAVLRANGVAVRWTPAAFALTHQKTLVADGNVAAIMTFNFTTQYYSTSRDFGVIDRDATDVAAIETAFDADWRGDKTTAPNGDDLVWSPGSEGATLALINSAKTSLEIYNEEMDDDDVTDALAVAAKRGVDVEVVMTYSSEWKSAFQELAAAGASVRTYSGSKKAPLYIHAKMILADNNTSDTIAFLGSENFSAASLNDNRELGIVFTDPTIIMSLAKTFASDYKNTSPFAP